MSVRAVRNVLDLHASQTPHRASIRTILLTADADRSVTPMLTRKPANAETEIGRLSPAPGSEREPVSNKPGINARHISGCVSQCAGRPEPPRQGVTVGSGRPPISNNERPATGKRPGRAIETRSLDVPDHA